MKSQAVRRALALIALALPASIAAQEAGPPPASDPVGAPAAQATPAEASPAPDVGASTDAPPERTPEKKAALRLGINSSDAPVNIASEKLEMVPAPGGGDLIRFRGAVRLDQGDLELTCDLLDAYYAQGQTGRPKKIVATGNVRMKQLDMRLSCRRATFVDDECLALCESDLACDSTEWPDEPAVLQRDTNTVSGRLLEFDLCTGELTAPCGAQVELRDRRRKTGSGGAKQGSEKPAEGAPKQAGSAPASERPADEPSSGANP